MKCVECGREFVAKGGGRPRKYCSNACRFKAYRERKAEAEADGVEPDNATRHDTKTDLSEGEFMDMLDPLPSYEDALRLVLRRLRRILDDETTQARDIAPISRIFIQTAKDLEDLRERESGGDLLAETGADVEADTSMGLDDV
ncbi:hypothetical protein [Bifidobacterium stellenboschense]|uniref:Terminase small subunit n=1 Tax=Bifidobacterium stellenboschense TaxID=762211 RepID=A0A087DMY1_9BIFI|nr:hypothetical protein [Bifidobacterium stellenboschense]KFI96881.1 hypothetical protein BSTEL_1790 [Bifidobacterium stellenboschense]